ncbi:MAG: hypothetical protein WAT79_13070 [Saprospiraceae bacterium]
MKTLKVTIIYFIFLLPFTNSVWSQNVLEKIELEEGSHASTLNFFGHEIILGDYTSDRPRITIIDKSFDTSKTLEIPSQNLSWPIHIDTSHSGYYITLSNGSLVKYPFINPSFEVVENFTNSLGTRHNLNIASIKDQRYFAAGTSSKGGFNSPTINYHMIYYFDLTTHQKISKQVYYETSQVKFLEIDEAALSFWHPVDSTLNVYTYNVDLIEQEQTKISVQGEIRSMKKDEQNRLFILTNYIDKSTIWEIVNKQYLKPVLNISGNYDEFIIQKNGKFILGDLYYTDFPFNPDSRFSISKVDSQGNILWKYEDDFSYSAHFKSIIQFDSTSILVSGDAGISDVTSSTNAYAIILGDFPIFTKENLKETGLTFYPNPACESIFLNAEFKEDKVELFQINGSRYELMVENGQVDISFLDKGIYFLGLKGIHVFGFPLIKICP